MPLFLADGKHFLTSEGVSEQQELLQKIQEIFHDKNAFQCGFCTTGVIMNLYTELLRNPNATQQELEDVLVDVSCRCTGYRPIIHATQKLYKDITGKGDGFNQREAELIFPRELRGYRSYKKMLTMKKNGEDFSYSVPKNMEGLKDLISEGGIIVGGGISFDEVERFASKSFVNSRQVKELREINIKDDHVVIGSSARVDEIRKFCAKWKKDVLLKTLFQVESNIASGQVTNVTTVGGNLFSDMPYISDLGLFFIGTNSKYNIMHYDGTVDTELAEKYINYIPNIKDHQFLHSVEIPMVDDDTTFIRYYKQKRRKKIDNAIVNCIMNLKFNKSSRVIEDIRFVAGGLLDEEYIIFDKVESFLKGNEFTQQVFDEAVEVLVGQIKDNSEKFIKRDMLDYRKTLILSYFYKYFLSFRKEIYNDVDSRIESTLEDFERKEFVGKVEYDEVIVGTSQGKKERNIYGRQIVDGTAVFVDDIPKMDGELQCHIVYSKVPHGKIKNIDASEALQMEGVVDWVDHRNIPGLNGFSVTGEYDEELLATDEVFAYGQPIGLVIAETREIAKKAAEKVKIDIEDLPYILHIDEAIEKNSFFEFYPQLKRGDPDNQFSKCEFILEGEVDIGGQKHFYGEVQSSLAYFEDGDILNIVASSQDLTGLQKNAGNALEIPYHRIVARNKRMGGAYGGKQSRSAFFGTLNAICSHKVKRPTRLVFDRRDDSQMSAPRHPYKFFYKVGFNLEGKIEALEMNMYSNGGFCKELSCPVMEHGMVNIDFAYNIPNAVYRGMVCKTNIVSPSAFRGFGAPQCFFAMEDVFSNVANYLGKDVYDVQKMNMYKEMDPNIYGQILERCNLDKVWDGIEEMSNYKERVKDVAEFNKENKYRKKGIAVVPLKYGLSYSEAPFLNHGSSLINIYLDGTVGVSVGGTEMGQGLMTKVCQVVASVLECPLENVYVVDTSTDKTPNAAPTAASIGSDVYCGGAYNAALQLAERLEPKKKELNFPDDSTFFDVVLQSFFNSVNLSAQGHYTLRDLNPVHWPDEPFHDDPPGPDYGGVCSPYWVYGSACAEVVVDCLTGHFDISRVDILQDCGHSLSPEVDVGQVEGGFVQGFGWCTTEDVVMADNSHDWNKEKGLYVSNNLDEYKYPLVNDIPQEFNITLAKELPPEEYGFQRSKASGEPPLFLGSVVYFAIKNAVLDFRSDELGIEDTTTLVFDLPATCERIRMACSDDFVRKFNDNISIKIKGSV